MSLRFVYGRAGSGKSRFCLEEIKKALESREERPLILIVPEQFSLQAELNLIKATGMRGSIMAEVLSFRRIAYRVFGETGGRVRKTVTQAGKNMVLSRIVKKRARDLKFFTKVSSQKGFVRTLSDVITEFRRYTVEPGTLEKAALDIEKSGGADSLSLKLRDLAIVFSDYENFLKKRYADPDYDLTLLCSKIEDSRIFTNADIWIDEFSGFTPQEYAVIGKLMLKARRVTVSLCTDSLSDDDENANRILFDTVIKTASRLARMAAENNVTIEKHVRLLGNRRHAGSPALMYLEKKLYSYPVNSLDGEIGEISVSAASDAFSEIEETAKKIIELTREKNYRFRDIAVVGRNIGEYEKIIKVVFRDYRIPFFMDIKRDIMNNPVVIFILSALEILDSNWTYESVFRYIKTGLTPLKREEADMLENYVLANGIRGGRWTQAEPWDFKPDIEFSDDSELTKEEKEKQYIENINLLRNTVAAPLKKFHTSARASKKSADICAAFYEFLEDNGLKGKIESIIANYETADEKETADEYRQAWEAVMALLDQVVEVFGNEPLDIATFKNLLEAGLPEYNIGLAPASVDQVLVGNVERSKNHEIKALFVLGVTDGVFPAAVTDDGILNDSDRNRLLNLGVELARDSKSKVFEERLLVYKTLTTPSEYLRLSWPASDMEGKARRPSRIISDLKRMFPGLKIIGNITGSADETDDAELIVSPLPAFNELVSVIRKLKEGKEVSKLWSQVYKWFNEQEYWNRHLKRIFSGMENAFAVKELSPARARNLFGRQIYSSVSRLESYSACPFSYFVEYGLKARERSIFTWKPVDTGTFMHNVLEKFSGILTDKKISWRDIDKDWCCATVSEIIDEMLNEMKGSIFKSTRRYEWLTEKLKKAVIRAILLISEHFNRSEFEPYKYEADFGEKGAYPPITVELPDGGKMLLTGRIDRIDKLSSAEGDYLRIIDYKSGKKDLRLMDVYYGLQLQLLVYLSAVMEAEGENVLPGGVLYFTLEDPLVRGKRSFTEEDIEKAVMKELKMKGLLLADVRLIRAMDRDLNGDSLIIPARINRGDVLGRSSAASAEQFSMLIAHIKSVLARLGAEIAKGNVAVSPYKKKGITACRWCSYSAVCQFDTAIKTYRYRFLRDMGDDEIWRIIQQRDVNATGWNTDGENTTGSDTPGREERKNGRQ